MKTDPDQRSRPELAADAVVAALARLLLRLYPSDFRREVGAELLRDHRLRSHTLLRDFGVSRWAFWLLRSLLSLVANAPMAWRERSLSSAAPRPSGSPVEALAYDVRYAVRQLAAAPALTLTASASIAVAIVVSVGAFSFLNSILFKPLPVREPETLYRVYLSDVMGQSRYTTSSYRDYVDFAKSGAFTELAASSRARDVALRTGDDPPIEGWLSFVSANWFDVLDVPLSIGRAPAAGERGVVLAHRFWRQRYGGDPAVLGKPLRANGHDLLITGIAPPSFAGIEFDAPAAGWAPVEALPEITGELEALESRGYRRFSLVGRLAPDTPPGAAEERLNGVAEALAVVDPRAWQDMRGQRRTVSVLSERESRTPNGESGELITIAGATTALIVLLLLVICTNVTSLLIARAVGRRREVAVRVALGATRERIVAQMLTESLLLALIGAALGLLTLLWVVRMAARVPILQPFDLAPDLRVMAVTAALTSVCALVFGSAPILHALRVDVRDGLASGGGTPGRNRLRGALIGGQVAVSCLLIFAAGSVAKAARTQVAAEPGVRLDGLLVAEITSVVAADGRDPQEYALEVERLVGDHVDVRSVARTTLLPLGGSMAGFSGRLPDGAEVNTGRNVVGADYFATVGASVLEGRTFAETDGPEAPVVAVVNGAFRSAFPGVRVGSFLDVREGERIQVIGVVSDIRYRGAQEPAEPLVYLHGPQADWSLFERMVVSVPVVEEQRVAGELRALIQERYPDRVPPSFTPMRQVVMAQALPRRVAARVALGVGTVELMMAAVGLYGLLLFVLATRTRELGVRLALGARPREASWAVLRRGLASAAIGGAAGLVLAVPAAKVGSLVMPGMIEGGPVPFAMAGLAVLLAGAAASLVPALRARRIQPAVALREE